MAVELGVICWSLWSVETESEASIGVSFASSARSSARLVETLSCHAVSLSTVDTGSTSFGQLSCKLITDLLRWLLICRIRGLHPSELRVAITRSLPRAPDQITWRSCTSSSSVQSLVEACDVESRLLRLRSRRSCFALNATRICRATRAQRLRKLCRATRDIERKGGVHERAWATMNTASCQTLSE